MSQAWLIWTGMGIGFLCLLVFFVQILRSLKGFEDLDRPFLRIILAVRNQQDIIESVLRRILASGRVRPLQVTVWDAGSVDQTPQIIGCLIREHEPVEGICFVEDGTMPFFACSGERRNRNICIDLTRPIRYPEMARILQRLLKEYD